MKGINLSQTSLEILSVFFANPDRNFYINELIRETGRYPNSIQKALISLAKQEILLSSRQGRVRLFKLNKSYKYLREMKTFVDKEPKQTINTVKQKINWVKILNRPSSYPFSVALCKSNANLDRIYGISAPTFWVNNITYGVYYSKDELALIGKVISEKIESDLGFAKRDILLCRRTCDRLVNFASNIPKKNLPGMSKSQITRIFKQFYEV